MLNCFFREVKLFDQPKITEAVLTAVQTQRDKNCLFIFHSSTLFTNIIYDKLKHPVKKVKEF